MPTKSMKLSLEVEKLNTLKIILNLASPSFHGLILFTWSICIQHPVEAKVSATPQGIFAQKV